MALSPLAQDTISRAIQECKGLIETRKPIWDELNTLYFAATIGFHTTIQQADLDAIPNLSGLTKQQLDDALTAIANALTQVTTSFTQLIELGTRTL